MGTAPVLRRGRNTDRQRRLEGPPVDGAAELGYAVAQARQGRGIATAAVRELVRRARFAGLHMVFAHTLAAESASTSVLARCGFTRVAELTDPDEGPVWRWELRLDDNARQRP